MSDNNISPYEFVTWTMALWLNFPERLFLQRLRSCSDQHSLEIAVSSTRVLKRQQVDVSGYHMIILIMQLLLNFFFKTYCHK